VRRLENTFQTLGYDVIIEEDLAASALKARVQEYAKSDIWENYSSMVLCVLSHGDEGVVCGVDKQPVRISELKYAFNHFDCLHLENKPKIFIIQACQGNVPQWNDNRVEASMINLRVNFYTRKSLKSIF
jgi:Caspase domain